MLQIQNLRPLIVYQDNNILVLEKPTGLLVHSTSAKNEYTLVDWLISKYPQIKKIKWPQKNRPGIVHRLDRDTSGLMVIAKNLKSYQWLKTQFKNRRVTKKYKVLVFGKVVPKKDVIVSSIGHGTKKMTALQGKPAYTKYQVEKYFTTSLNTDPQHKILSLLIVEIKTGRTHQIRVHFKSTGHPVVGDQIYAKGRDKKVSLKLGLKRQFLHSIFLGFYDLNGKWLEFKSELPQDLKLILEQLIELD